MLVTENFYRFLDSLELIIIKKLMTDDRLNAKLFFPLFLLQTSVSGVIIILLNRSIAYTVFTSDATDVTGATDADG